MIICNSQKKAQGSDSIFDYQDTDVLVQKKDVAPQYLSTMELHITFALTLQTGVYSVKILLII